MTARETAHKIFMLMLVSGFSSSTDFFRSWDFYRRNPQLSAVARWWERFFVFKLQQLFSFIILLTSIFTFFFFGEIRNLTTFCLLNNNGFSLSKSYFFLLVLTFLWIGAQFPQERFLSYGRILTLHYYFLLMCILFSPFSYLELSKNYFLQNKIRSSK